MIDLIDPKEVVLKDGEGREHKFLIGKIPYLSGGRKVISGYLPTSSKSEQYEQNEDLARILFRHCEVVKPERNIRLETDDLVNNHLHDAQLAIKLEEAAFQRQVNFYPDGGLFGHLGDLGRLIAALASKTETPLQPASSELDTAPFTN